MTEMVERAAKAMRGVAYLLVCEAVRARNRADPLVAPPDPLIEHEQIVKEWHEQKARAAIAAMREPTEQQLRHADQIIGPWGGHGEPCAPSEATVWRAMIDGALKE